MDRAQVLHRMMREELSQELLGKWVHWQYVWHKTIYAGGRVLNTHSV